MLRKNGEDFYFSRLIWPEGGKEKYNALGAPSRRSGARRYGKSSNGFDLV